MIQTDSLITEIFQNLNVEIALFNRDLQFEFINQAMEEDSEIRNSLIGMTDAEWCERRSISPAIAEVRERRLKKSIQNREKIQYEEKFRLYPDFPEIYLLQTIVPIINENGEIEKILRYGIDISDQKRNEQRIEYAANHDSLTGLPNRRFLNEKMKGIISRQDKETYISLILLDLDRFKEINDNLGHNAGDNLIRQAADRLIDLFLPLEKFAVIRLGGDEFLVVLYNLDNPKTSLEYSAGLVDTFRIPFHLAEHELFITTSVGVYTCKAKDFDENIEDAVQKADIAMYSAKASGRNKFREFLDGMIFHLADSFALETKLYKALKKDEFFVQYQPKIGAASHSICGAEALLRWNCGGEIIYPASYMKEAENSGILILIGYKVFHSICQDLRKWKEAGIEITPVAVNVSARQFYDEKLITTVRNILKKNDIPGKYFEIEIQEHVIMKDTAEAVRILTSLKELGLSISLDNFGAGTSSLAKIKSLPVQKINIDGSFISQVTENYQDAAIVSAIVAMGQKLKLEVNAGGIENREQLNFMKNLNCTNFSGRLFSDALNPEAFRSLLESKKDFSAFFKD